jgi:sugar-specific transcriptional regulator TrmB
MITGGLNEKEAMIYLALLELGSATVIDIAKKIKLKRTSVYNLLPGLLDKGLVKTMFVRKKRHFFIDDPRGLQNSLVEKEKKLNLLLPELRALHNVIPQKPKISYYEGEGGMRELYRDSLSSCAAGDTILAYTGMVDFYKVFPKDFSDEYIAERIKRKIRVKVIAPKTAAAQDWLQTAPQSLRQIKLINQEGFTFKADTEIYANKVAMISYKENFMGVVIESKEISDMQKSAFEVMWRAL